MSTEELVKSTTVCNNCGSVNRLEITLSSEAWECWNCQDRHWFDDDCRKSYAARKGIGLLRADIDLDNGFPIFAGAAI